MAQIGNTERADGFQVIDVTAGGHFNIVCNDGMFGQESGGNIIDIFTAIAVFREAFMFGGNALATRQNRYCEVVNLCTGIVVVKLTCHIPAVCIQQAR